MTWKDVLVVWIAFGLTYGILHIPILWKLSPTSVDWTWPANCQLAHLDSTWDTTKQDVFVCDQFREKD